MSTTDKQAARAALDFLAGLVRSFGEGMAYGL